MALLQFAESLRTDAVRIQCILDGRTDERLKLTLMLIVRHGAIDFRAPASGGMKIDFRDAVRQMGEKSRDQSTIQMTAVV